MLSAPATTSASFKEISHQPSWRQGTHTSPGGAPWTKEETVATEDILMANRFDGWKLSLEKVELCG